MSRAVQGATAFIVIIAIARYLSIEDFGNYSFVIALVGSIMSISLFGVGTILVRETSRNEEMAPEYTGIALTLRLALITVSGVVVILLTSGMNVPWRVFWAVVLGVLAFGGQSHSQLCFQVFQAFERMKYEPLVNFIGNVVLLVGLAVAIVMNLGLIGVFGVIAGAGLIKAGVASVVAFGKCVFPKFTFTREELAGFFKEAALAGIGVFIHYNMFRVNVLLLKWLGNLEEVAYFHAVHGIILQIAILPTAFVTAMYPRICRLTAQEDGSLLSIYEKVLTYLFLGGFSIAMVVFCYSKQIVILLLGDKFVGSVIALQVLSWATIALFVDVFIRHVLIATGKLRANIVIGVLALMINLCLGIFLIPLWGRMGAAWAALLSYLALGAISYIYIFVVEKRLFSLQSIIKICFAGCGFVTVVIYLKNISLVGSFVLGVCVYSVLLWISGVITIDDLKGYFFTEMMRRGERGIDV